MEGLLTLFCQGGLTDRLDVLGPPHDQNTFERLDRMVPSSGIWDIYHHEWVRGSFLLDYLLSLRLCNLDLTDRNVVEPPASLKENVTTLSMASNDLIDAGLAGVGSFKT